ncbi:hypothetical protein RWV98_02860 [Agathobaculum sp. NTUH-O15-33]|uniref:hypothetical protein n=1 Tax=Agathobaculum sp. NTUH-O15-33 TaxID=3079302 RepID=UPI0029583B72|nr:hypothetical protein [Agathobaculum sp. NTUH-O15-33]WNX85233.1 hypothetical protein RWV98_02860 [Agathobaculum sp. NTUH-O15-33]
MPDTKTDLIDRAETIDAIKRLGDGYEPQGYRTALRDAVEAIEQVDALHAQNEDNPPLTLEELRGMSNTDLVWVVFPELPPEDNCWYRAKKLYDLYSHAHYGKTWLAYRRKPEGGGE